MRNKRGNYKSDIRDHDVKGTTWDRTIKAFEGKPGNGRRGTRKIVATGGAETTYLHGGRGPWSIRHLRW